MFSAESMSQIERESVNQLVSITVKQAKPDVLSLLINTIHWRNNISA